MRRTVTNFRSWADLGEEVVLVGGGIDPAIEEQAGSGGLVYLGVDQHSAGGGGDYIEGTLMLRMPRSIVADLRLHITARALRRYVEPADRFELRLQIADDDDEAMIGGRTDERQESSGIVGLGCIGWFCGSIGRFCGGGFFCSRRSWRRGGDAAGWSTASGTDFAPLGTAMFGSVAKVRIVPK